MPKPKRVLVVDDEEGICEGVELVLERVGFEVRKALNAEEAIRLVEDEAFDVVLMDMILPGMDGVDACGKVKELRPETRIVAITGSPTGERFERLLGAHHIDQFLYKPFGKKELLEIVEKALQ